MKDMSGIFLGTTSFNDDLSNWDVSSVKDMYGMFWGATFFKRQLCGTAWAHSQAKKTIMFAVTSGSISTTTCTTRTPMTLFSSQSRDELKSVLDACLKLSPTGDSSTHTDQSESGTYQGCVNRH